MTTNLTTETTALGDLAVGDTVRTLWWDGTTRTVTVRETWQLNEDTELRLSDQTTLSGSSRRCTVERLVLTVTR